METSATISPEKLASASKNKIAMLLILGLGALLIVISAIGYLLYETGNLHDRYILEWKDVIEPRVTVEKTATGEELVIKRRSILHSAMIVKDTKTEIIGDTLHIRTSLRMQLPFEQRSEGAHMMWYMQIFNESRVALPEGVHRVVFGTEETLIWERTSVPSVTDDVKVESNSKDGTGRSKALEIAASELKRNFPDMKRDGNNLEVVTAKQSADDASRWTVTYDAPNSLDAQVVITVDVATGEVIAYQDSWS